MKRPSLYSISYHNNSDGYQYTDTYVIKDEWDKVKKQRVKEGWAVQKSSDSYGYCILTWYNKE